MDGAKEQAAHAADGARQRGRGRPPHTLHIYRRFHPDYTGDGIYYARLLPAVEAEGGGTGEFLAFETDPPGPGALPPPTDLPIHYLRAEGLPATSWGLLRWLWRNVGRFDTVHLHSHVDRRFLSYILARLLGRRVLYSCTLDDSPTQLLAFYRPAFRPLAGLLMHSIGVFVVISPQLLRLSLETVPPKRLRFIPQGTHLGPRPEGPERRRERRRQLGLGESDFLLLNVGSVSRRKNLAFLVDALALVPEPDVKLVVVGPELEEDYAAELRQRVAARGIEGRVVLAGFQSNAGDFYEAADAFVFASTSEGFPNVFLEAMARGLPIVSRFLPGLTDYVIEHGRTGLLADSPAEFAAALRTLRDDPARRAAMGVASRGFAERNLGLPAVARRYAALYREGAAGGSAAARRAKEEEARRDFPDLRIAFAPASAPGPAALGLTEFDTPWLAQPVLQVVIDTEADFDWDKGIWTDTGRTASIVGLQRHAALFLRHGVKPTLVLDHPIATDPRSAAVVRELAAEGCELGVHLHTWTTPPLVEPKDDWHSFSGNLGPWLERCKLEELSARVAALSGENRPRLFKGGRYGIGGNTVAALRELGFEVDLSISPAFDYSPMGGPDFTRFTSRPGWYGAPGGLLSLPTTSRFLGWSPGDGRSLASLLRHPLGRRLHLPRAAALANALYPARLSPEGMGYDTMCRLARSLVGDGVRVLTLSLHSPSLLPGNTPYARNQAELDRLVRDTDRFLTFFREEMGGRFATASEIRAALLPRSAATA